jgi:hypothetical protein
MRLPQMRWIALLTGPKRQDEVTGPPLVARRHFVAQEAIEVQPWLSGTPLNTAAGSLRRRAHRKPRQVVWLK